MTSIVIKIGRNRLAYSSLTRRSIVDRKSRERFALVLLVSAKAFGIVGLVLGVTPYRPLGGALLAMDGILLITAVAMAVRNMSETKVEEKDRKALLRQMVAEGTLKQYLADIRDDASAT